MCCNDQGFLMVRFVPKSKKPNLETSGHCSELPNIVLELLEESGVVCLLGKVDIV